MHNKVSTASNCPLYFYPPTSNSAASKQATPQLYCSAGGTSSASTCAGNTGISEQLTVKADSAVR